MVRAGKIYEICLKFLLKVDKSSTIAEFDTKARVLSVTVSNQVSDRLFAPLLHSHRKYRSAKTFQKKPLLVKVIKL